MILSPPRRAITTHAAAGKTKNLERLEMKKFKSHKVVEAANDNQPLPVAGYRPQSDDKVDVVNKHKILEERTLRRIDQLRHENAVARSAEAPEPYDSRMLALAFTGIQDAFMWLNRAVFQPDRVALPEDEDDAAHEA